MSSAPTQYCPNCGEANPIDAQSCWNCGQALPTSDERQELWATREDDQAGQERDEREWDDRDGQNRSEDASGWARPATGATAMDQPAASFDRDPGQNPNRGGEATEPFLTPASTRQPEPRAGQTRTYPATWGAPNPDASGSSGRQRTVQDGDRDSPSRERTAATTPASSYGYGSGYGAAGQPGSEHAAGGPAGSGPPWFDQSGYGQPGYGQPPTGPAGYASWAQSGPEGGVSPDAPDPYGQGYYGPQPYGLAGYGQDPYGQSPYAGQAGPYAGGEPPYGGRPGGPVLAAAPRGPSGCLLGALGVVLIALVGAVLIAIVAYNAATGGQLRNGLRDVASTEVTQLGPVDVPEDGRLTVSEADVNRTIRRYTDDYGAISDPTFEIAGDGVELNFSVLGIDSSYRSGLIAEGGQLRLTNPEASGAAARVLSADDMTGIVEPALNDILAQSGVTATGVELGDGELTVLTAATGATPAAGTPVATPVAAGSVEPITTGSAAPSASGSADPVASGSPASKPGDFIGIFGGGASSSAPAAGSPSPSSSLVAPTVSQPSSSPSASGSPQSDLD